MKGSAWGRHLFKLGRAFSCCLTGWLAGILCNMASQLAAPVCTCSTALSRSKRSHFPLRARRTRHRRPNRLQAAVSLACLWQHRLPEQPAWFEQAIAYELRRLPRKAEGAPDEQRLQAVAQQSSQELLVTSAMPLLSSLQQLPTGQYLTVMAFHGQAGPPGPTQGVWPGRRVRIRPSEHVVLHALLSGLGLSTKALRQALPRPILFQSAHWPVGQCSLRGS